MRAGSFAFGLGMGLSRGASAMGRLGRGGGRVCFRNSRFVPMCMNTMRKNGLNSVCTGQVCGESRGNRVVVGGKMPMFAASRRCDLSRPVNGVRPSLLVSMAPDFACGNFALSTLFSVGFKKSIISMSRTVTADRNVSGHARRENRLLLPKVGRSNAIGAREVSTRLFCRTMNKHRRTITRRFICGTSFVHLGRVSFKCSFPDLLLEGAPISDLEMSFIKQGLTCLVGRAPKADPRNKCSADVFSRTLSFSSLPCSHAFNFDVGINFWGSGGG